MPKQKIEKQPHPIEDDVDRKIWDEGYKAGEVQGARDMRVKALTFLEKKYMNRGVPKDDPYARAILDLARELAKELKP